ncbi:MAG: CPBP family intramembrane metalloprotease [Cyclobacteriaceae bacterium]
MNLKIKSLGFALLFCVLFRLSFGFGSFINNTVHADYYWFSLGAYGTISVLLITAVFLKIERRKFRDIGLNWESGTLPRFIKGALFGFVLTWLMTLVIILFADLKIELAADYNVPVFLFWSSAWIPLGFMEEVAFRSYPFLKLNKVFGLRITQLVIAILFALYHVGEDSIITAFVGPGIWAFVYGMAAVYSKGIALPTGLHFAANFVLASMGEKKGVDPVFIVNYVTEPTTAMLNQTQYIAYAVQFVMLIVSVVLMERYIRCHKSDYVD